MKFTPSIFKLQATKEYSMYTYMNAINDTRVEMYGIPSVHYFGVWNDYILMAITLLNSKCNVKPKTGSINEVDCLIVCRDIVRVDPKQWIYRLNYFLIYSFYSNR